MQLAVSQFHDLPDDHKNVKLPIVIQLFLFNSFSFKITFTFGFGFEVVLPSYK